MFNLLTGKGLFKVMLFAMVAIIAVGCSVHEKKDHAPSMPRLQERVGVEMVQSIEQAKQVSVAKVVREGSSFSMAKNTHVLTGDKVQQLKKYLLNDEGYFFNKTKKCLFIPEVAFRLEGERNIQLMLSLSCNQIRFIENGVATTLDYDPMAEKLNGFCREIIEQLEKDKSKN